MRKRSTQASGNIEEEENQLSLRSCRPRIGSVPTTNNQPNTQFEFNMMGNMTDCIFYVPDVAGDSTGLAFRVAYKAAVSYNPVSNQELCAYVGSMLCSVIPGFKNTVETSLKATGIRPRFMSLPSQAHQNKIVISRVPQMDWSSILVIFGYCLLLLFKIDEDTLFRYNSSKYNPRFDRVNELRRKVGCSPSNLLSIPFDEKKENAIRTMLGTRHLRETVITFLMNKFDHPDAQICSLCQYLSYKLSWSGDMRVFAVMNERLIKTKSPVLSHSLVTAEVDNLEETMKAIGAHTYPQYFSHLCSDAELFHLHVSRFRTLFAVALELDRTFDSSYDKYYSSAGVSEASRMTVEKLLELHLEAMEENKRVTTTGRCLPTIRGI